MRAHRVFATIAALSLLPAVAFARTEWRRYIIPSTGTRVDIPVTIFSENAGPVDGGLGRRFLTKDHRSDLTVQAIPNPRMIHLQVFSPRCTRLRGSSIRG